MNSLDWGSVIQHKTQFLSQIKKRVLQHKPCLSLRSPTWHLTWKRYKSLHFVTILTY